MTSEQKEVVQYHIDSKFIMTMKMIDGTWLDYLEEIDNTAKEMVDKLVKELATKHGMTEGLKAKDQMAWVSTMEQIKHTAEEFVFEDILYKSLHKIRDIPKLLQELEAQIN